MAVQGSSHDVSPASRVRLPEDDGSWTIGRSPDCDIVLPEETVAEVHAIIKRQDGLLSVADSGAFAGVYVNGTRVQEQVIVDGDDIFISPIHLEVTDGDIVFSSRSDRGFRIDAVEVNRWVGDRTLVEEVSVSILPGEFVAMIGPSGCGKSTIVSLLSGIKRPSLGTVLYDGESLYDNLEHFRPHIGFVAQFPATHTALTVMQTLQYEAELRLHGTTPEARMQAINRSLDTVDLDHRCDTCVAFLSGGERKRLAIAIELLCDPKVLWLDEPTSGLDPHLNRRFMELFRELSNSGITVIVVTHDTDGLELCDRLVFLVPGGRVAYDGRPELAPRRFGARDITECYHVAQSAGSAVADQHDLMSGTPALFPRSRRDSTRVRSSLNSMMHQMVVKTRRTAHLWWSDRRNLLIMLAQAPLLGLLLSMLLSSQVFIDMHVPAARVIDATFVMSITVIWLGLINSSRAFSSEQLIWKRERMTGASIPAYVGAKLVMQALLNLYQASALVMVIGISHAGLPSAGLLGLPGWSELIVTMALTGTAAATMGLLLSAVVSSEDRGSSLVPYLVLPQLLMCGLLLHLPANIAWISMGTLSYWSIASMASVLDACSHPFTGGPTCADAMRVPLSHDAITMVTYWGVLVGFIVVGVAIICAALTIRDRARYS